MQCEYPRGAKTSLLLTDYFKEPHSIAFLNIVVEGRHLWARGPQRAATIASAGRTPFIFPAASLWPRVPPLLHHWLTGLRVGQIRPK